jgi:hypothetical protein
MAMTGRFDANFASFYEAVDKAVVQLKGFDAATGTVSTSLSRMVDQFSGRQIITEATLIAKALDDVGGVARVTNSELQKIGPTMSEAAEKLRAYGQDVPANIQKYANAAEQATNATTSWSEATSTFTGVLGALGIQTSVGALVNYAKEIVATAEHLDKLNAKTGIAVETLQRFEVAGNIAGNSLDEISAAALKLTENVAEGKSSTVNALAQLGIKADEFAHLSIEQKFDAVAEAIKRIPDPTDQVTIALDLMGQAGVRVLPTLKSDIDGVSKSVGTMSADTVSAFATMSAEMTKHAANLKAEVGNVLIALFGGWTAGERAAKALNDSLKPIGETTLPGITTAFMNMIPNAIPSEVDELNNKIDASAIAARQAASDTAMWAKVLGDLHETTFKLAMDHEKQWREETEKDLKAHNQAVVDGLNQTQSAQAKYFDYLDKATLDSSDYQIKKIWERVNAEELAFKGTEDQRARYNAIVEAQADAETAAIVAALDKQAAATEAAMDKEIAAIKRTNEGYYAQLDAIMQITEAANAASGTGPTGAVVGHRPGEPGSELHAGADIPNGGTNWGSPSGVAGSFVGSTIEARLKALADEMARYPNTPINVSNLFAGLTGFGEGGSGDFGSGTPVMLHGREAIVPLDKGGSDLRYGGSAGTSGGVLNLTINVTQPLGTPEAIARAVGDAQIALLKGQGVRLPYGA